VTPADIRWLLELTAPRVHAANAHQYRKQEVDAVAVAGAAAIVKALDGGAHLTRPELARALADAGIAAAGLRLAYIVMWAELNGLISSGPRRGRQFTYTLLDERAPGARRLAREEALAELATRYFASHGPALPEDFAWWSGLTLAESRTAIELAGSSLAREVMGGRAWWLAPSPAPGRVPPWTVHLLPLLDEYLIAYRERSATFDRSLLGPGTPPDVPDGHVLVVGGQVLGGWRRTVERDGITVEVRPLAPLGEEARASLGRAASRYEQFLGQPVRLGEWTNR
jgi:Winged helix DNA-binding domain